MATFEVTIEEITVFPHPNADLLELARVGLYNIVVAKGAWKTGDKVLYVPEYAILPEPIIEALGLTGKLAGSKKNRVKPIVLRGALSQGVVIPLNLLPEGAVDMVEDGNFASVLGITKWEPEVPASLSGSVTGAPELIRWIDIENLKKFPNLFDEGDDVVITEKIHGTCSCYTFTNPNGDNTLTVTSKGLGSRNLALKDEGNNLYWMMARKYDLPALSKLVAETFPHVEMTKIAVFGETFGNVQDLKYGYTNGGHGFVVFDIYVEYNEKGKAVEKWLNPEEVELLASQANVPTPPTLYTGKFSLEKVLETATGAEQVSGTEAHIREGVVIRPAHRVLGHSAGGAKIAKYVSDAYLTRKGGTEFN